MTALFIDRGATLTNLYVADREGRIDDVIVGFHDPRDYFAPHPHLGCIVGRCANRIRNSRCSIDGQVYALAPTHPPHHLHGGPDGFHSRRWRLEYQPLPAAVRFSLDSPDGDQGYPGRVHVIATYSFTATGALRLVLTARCDRATVINLTAHPYFNLAGAAQAVSIADHTVRIAANHYLPIDTDLVPTGEIASVSDTAFDLRKSQRLGPLLANDDEQRHRAGAGFDHNFVVDGTGMRFCAEVSEPIGGRRLTLFTDQPGVQFYTGNTLDIVGKSGLRRQIHHGLCLETQGFPNAINEPGFPSVIVRPTQRYHSVTEWHFDTVPS
jgi:aldose 1-epimerase